MKKYGRQVLSVTLSTVLLCTVFSLGSLTAFAGTNGAQEYGRRLYSYTLAGRASENPAALGDINADGKINAVDARWVLQSASGARTLDNVQIIAADVNGDDKVNAVDARWILQVASGARTLGESTTEPTPPTPEKDDNVSVGTEPDDDRDAVIIW